jgi:type IV secretory pathway TrbD component
MTTATRRRNAVYRSLNRPLTILGAERKLFFFALMMGAATFNLLATLLGGILMFLTLYLGARWAISTDPQMLRFILNSPKLRTQYDPAKFAPVAVRRFSGV